jgi:hypothetical protein
MFHFVVVTAYFHQGNEKWIKWVKINERTLAALLTGKTLLSEEEAQEIGLL